MKDKFVQYFSLISCLTLLFTGVVVYSKGQQYKAAVYENKAIIAMAQPAIIAARGQYALNLATAGQITANTIVLSVLAILPYVAMFVYIVVKEGGKLYAEIRDSNRDTTEK